MVENPDFINALPVEDGKRNYNLAVPTFVLKCSRTGVGLVMSHSFSGHVIFGLHHQLSLQQRQGSLQALRSKGEIPPQKQLVLSRFFTVFGITDCLLCLLRRGYLRFCHYLSQQDRLFGHGPILAMFLLGILTRFANEKGDNGPCNRFDRECYSWKFAPQVSWLWWSNRFFCCLRSGGCRLESHRR